MRGERAFTGEQDLGSGGGERGSTHKNQSYAAASEMQGKGGASHNPSFSKAQASASHQENQGNKPSVFSSNTESFDEKLKAVQDKIKKEYDSRIVIKEKHLSFNEIEDQLKERIFELATGTIDKPITLNTSRELRFGKDREIRVALSGKYQGFYHNFETGIKGGPLKLIEDQQGLSSRDALKWAADWLGGSQMVIERHTFVKKKEISEDKRSEWKPIIPVPKDQENPDIAGNKYLNVMLKDGSKEVARYAYRDEQGNLKGYVVRFEKPDGDKILKKTPPLAYCENGKGQRAWRWVAFEKENKTPYKIEILSQDPYKPILVVEGEKTADAAQKFLPEYHVLTWSGGAGNVDKTNWEPLVGKTVVIWPDYDYDGAGREAAKKLQNILTQLNKAAAKEVSVGIVDLLKHLPNSEYLPNKWDLADKLPEGWTNQTVRKFIKEAIGEQCESLVSKIDDRFSSQQHQTFQAPHSKFDILRQEFERERLVLHQDWCVTLGFMAHHKRFPENAEELRIAYWQGERLTTIEGRLYAQALEREKKIDEKQLTLQARDELLKNQAIPTEIMLVGKATDLTETQLKQFEQHVLIHQDRTNKLPNTSELDKICKTIKIHEDFMGKERNRDIYTALIEQQAVLFKINSEQEILPTTLKVSEIKNFCSDKIERMNAKIHSFKAFAQEMKTRDLSRQNQRGLDM